MQAVILAGGLGTRLRPLTYTRPKALVPLLNRPMVLHLLDGLPPAVDRVLLAANYRVDALRAYFAEREDDPPVQVVEEAEPLGTGGALKNLEARLDDTFLTYNGDVISSLNSESLLAAHRARGGLGTLALWEVEDPTPFGVVDLDAESRVQRFREKPPPGEAPSRLVNAGVYALEPEILDLIPPDRPVSLEREVFPKAAERGLYGMEFEGYWSDAGTRTSYLAAQRALLDRVAQGPRGAEAGRFRSPVLVDETAEVEGGVVGPYACLGPGCHVEDAFVENAVLLERTRVEPGAHVEGSLVGAGATVARDARLEECILADGAVAERGVRFVGARVFA